MHDFYCTNPNEMYYKTLADRVRYFKESEKGVNNMCELMKELRDEGYNEGWKGGWADGMEKGWVGGMADGELKKAKETACKLAGRGDSVELIADIVGYDVKTVDKWLEEYRVSLS